MIKSRSERYGNGTLRRISFNDVDIANCIFCGNIPMLEHVLENIGSNTLDTALSLALSTGNTEMCDFVISKMSSVQSHLMSGCIMSGKPEMFKYLKESHGMLPQFTDLEAAIDHLSYDSAVYIFESLKDTIVEHINLIDMLICATYKAGFTRFFAYLHKKKDFSGNMRAHLDIMPNQKMNCGTCQSSTARHCAFNRVDFINWLVTAGYVDIRALASTHIQQSLVTKAYCTAEYFIDKVPSCMDFLGENQTELMPLIYWGFAKRIIQKRPDLAKMLLDNVNLKIGPISLKNIREVEEAGIPVEDEVIEISRGAVFSLDDIKWAYEVKKLEIEKPYRLLASYNGDIKLVKYVLDKNIGAPIPLEDFVRLCRRMPINQMEIFRKHPCTFGFTFNQFVDTTSDSMDLEKLQFLYSLPPEKYEKGIIVDGAGYEQGITVDDEGVSVNHLFTLDCFETAKWLLKNRIGRIDRTASVSPEAVAVEFGSLKILEFLKPHIFPKSIGEIATNAVKCQSMDLIKYVFSEVVSLHTDFCCTDGICLDPVEDPQLEIFRPMLYQAIRHGNKQAVEFLKSLEIGDPPRQVFIDLAASDGSAMMEYLFNLYGPERCKCDILIGCFERNPNTKVLDFAARHDITIDGKINAAALCGLSPKDMAKIIEHHRPDDQPSLARHLIWFARQKGRLGIESALERFIKADAQTDTLENLILESTIPAKHNRELAALKGSQKEKENPRHPNEFYSLRSKDKSPIKDFIDSSSDSSIDFEEDIDIEDAECDLEWTPNTKAEKTKKRKDLDEDTIAKLEGRRERRKKRKSKYEKKHEDSDPDYV